jgi:hypothetical protein
MMVRVFRLAAQLRKVKLDEREELVNEASEKYEKALKADPEDA